MRIAVGHPVKSVICGIIKVNLLHCSGKLSKLDNLLSRKPLTRLNCIGQYVGLSDSGIVAEKLISADGASTYNLSASENCNVPILLYTA